MVQKVNNASQGAMMRAMNGECVFPPPVWLMRQAGRYLPEYRATRQKAGSFLDLCFTPELAVEVTLQPIRRFGFDAAILFSDILVIPHALGRRVAFEEGVGPRLEPISAGQIAKLEIGGAIHKLAPVMEAIAGIRANLPRETALLGFCGAPWTVATYMIAGQGTADQAPARLFSLREKAAFQRLIDLLADISADYLIAQLRAGVDAVQVFDSWAGVLGEADFAQWCVAPVRSIVSKVRSAVPDAKIIGFPRGAGMLYADYRRQTGVDALGLDWTVPMNFARALQKGGAVQGNLDPLRLVAGGAPLSEAIDAILANLGHGPLIFNLGHGITPETPIGHVEAMLQAIRNRPHA